LPFTAAQYTFCDDTTWTMHFNRMFPAVKPASIGQNFRQATYYAQWANLRESLNPQGISRVRTAIKIQFDTLKWIPYTQTDKMWSTRKVKGRQWHSLPERQNLGGPLIALSPKATRARVGRPSLRPTPQV
ncbi:hypothetical protein PAXRUDRAFT_38298, partial [Paxillus rubicundulus Ve08.2h10]